LREYQGLYQSEEQPARLRHLREVAVKVMREFGEFRPALVGSVLSGTAGQHSDVNLQLFTDDPKALTLFLLNRRYRFEESTRNLSRGGRMEPFPQISFDVDDVTVTLTVLDRDDERSSPKPREAEALQRARVEQVEAMLAATPGA
jgi:predicted nucleotidyltransferase